LARGLCQFEGEAIEFIIFPTGPNRKIHEKLASALETKKLRGKVLFLNGKLSLLLWAIDTILTQNALRANFLRRAVDRFKPDFVHILEFQHAGYIAAKLPKSAYRGAKIIATNYGSDIYWFQRFPRHRFQIKKVLALADAYSAECERDVELARKFFFKGDILKTIPNSGSQNTIDISDLNDGWGARNLILVKGYQGWAGDAIKALRAVWFAAGSISNLRVVVYSSNLLTWLYANFLRNFIGLPMVSHLKNTLSHEEMLGLMDKALVHLAVSKTDGLSTTTLEAVARGVYPVQSSSSCIGEWVEDRVTGYIFEPEIKVVELARILQDALASREKLLTAAETNVRKLNKMLSKEDVVRASREFYLKRPKRP
jgi:glycosyltransferase involved in cell wall biosynthesis